MSADHGGSSSPARVGVGASGGFEAELARTPVTLAQREARIVEREAQVAELTIELQRRKKGVRPKANAISRPKRDKDGQAKGERKHPGVVRPPVALSPNDIFTTCEARPVSTVEERSKTRTRSTNTPSKTSGHRVWKSLVIGGIDSVARAVARCLTVCSARGRRRLCQAAHPVADGRLPGASGDLAGQVHRAARRGVRAEAESRRCAGAHSVGQRSRRSGGPAAV